MSSLWVRDPALGRPVAFAVKERLLLQHLAASPKLAGVTPASRLEVRPAPEMVSSGIPAIDALTGGLPRGCLTEVCGGASSGRTSMLLAALAAATRRQEVCALVDVCDAFDPASAAAAGVDFSRLLWVRCGSAFSPQRHRDTEKTRNQENTSTSATNEGRNFGKGELRSPQRLKPHSAGSFDRSAEALRHPKPDEAERIAQAVKAADLLLQSGGFGLVAMDLGDVSIKMARRIPLTSWFRFQRAVENTPTVLFGVTPVPCAQSCAALLLEVRAAGELSALSCQLSAIGSQLSGNNALGSHVQFLKGLHIEVEILRSRLRRGADMHRHGAGTVWAQRKPAQSITTAFTTRAVCTG